MSLDVLFGNMHSKRHTGIYSPSLPQHMNMAQLNMFTPPPTVQTGFASSPMECELINPNATRGAYGGEEYMEARMSVEDMKSISEHDQFFTEPAVDDNGQDVGENIMQHIFNQVNPLLSSPGELREEPRYQVRPSDTRKVHPTLQLQYHQGGIRSEVVGQLLPPRTFQPARMQNHSSMPDLSRLSSSMQPNQRLGLYSSVQQVNIGVTVNRHYTHQLVNNNNNTTHGLYKPQSQYASSPSFMAAIQEQLYDVHDMQDQLDAAPAPSLLFAAQRMNSYNGSPLTPTLNDSTHATYTPKIPLPSNSSTNAVNDDKQGRRSSCPELAVGATVSSPVSRSPVSTISNLTVARAASTDGGVSMARKKAAVGGGVAGIGQPGFQGCSNCGCLQTSLWRRGPTGERVCNACGLYRKVYAKERPPAMASKGVTKRRRRKNSVDYGGQAKF
eukprot:comp18373_c0_seq1/m.19532 comp18373_c0_seq1/g.19532  ORF comp18373_c0_seq1/g.19532 comp18373_c0_seq1/m.19532 type:complete len:442 (-) comp18373_c0_seq1:688-2013(-)